MNNQTKINILITCLLLIVLNEYILNKIFNKKEGFNPKKQITRAWKKIRKMGKSITELFTLVLLFPLLLFFFYLLISVILPILIPMMIKCISLLFKPIPI